MYRLLAQIQFKEVLYTYYYGCDHLNALMLILSKSIEYKEASLPRYNFVML